MSDEQTRYKQALIDIPGALRNDIDNYVFDIENELADLRAQLAEARKVIEPFRKFIRIFEETTAKTQDDTHTLAYADLDGDTYLTLGDLRAAAEFLAKWEADNE